ncbi:hypothetical protein [Vibrio hangzhouensis]|uniref:Uncharacterized protein n=1 Tax=Vibrio hangzhouensis TaxID=462991 RepID=A0A1H5VWK3_9VIBR|nr:hypothetical protein [Vibrio hangzhouensis]SEF91368.1 hypothetical protein SAMN04488244_10528 [Vibrio hangzhouensis]
MFSLVIYSNTGASGIVLAQHPSKSQTPLLSQWEAIPPAQGVTGHFLVLRRGEEHLDSKFIRYTHVCQLLELWGEFDQFYQELPCGK